MHRFDKKQLSSAPSGAFRAQISVRFQDVDAAGIVFFARMFDYVHVAYEEFLEHVGHPLPRVIAERKWAAPLRHAEADYLSPCRFGDVLDVELVAAHVEDSEISLGWRLRNVRQPLEDRGARPIAVVQTVHAFVSLPSFERCEVPASIVKKLASIAS